MKKKYSNYVDERQSPGDQLFHRSRHIFQYVPESMKNLLIQDITGLHALIYDLQH